jgi:hypothetical protein
VADGAQKEPWERPESGSSQGSQTRKTGAHVSYGSASTYLCQVFGRYLGVTSLQMCALLGTKITDAGFADLQKALANCEIVK